MIGRGEIAQRLRGWVFVGVNVFLDTFLPGFFFLFFFSFALRIHEAFYFRALPLRILLHGSAAKTKSNQIISYHIIYGVHLAGEAGVVGTSPDAAPHCTRSRKLMNPRALELW